MRWGLVATVGGTGCGPATLARATSARELMRFDPDVGTEVGDFESVTVTGATLSDGLATWTMQPAAGECENDSSSIWSTEERSWSVIHRASSYTIRASRLGGVRSIAGFRVDRYTRRSAPTIRRARRHFGRPSSIRRRYGVGCRARWNRLGLTIDLINLGGRKPCRHGFVQAGRVDATRGWTAMVAGDPGVAYGTSDDFLAHELIGEPGETGRRWTLAEVYIPYGEDGYYPSISALLGPRGRVSGYEFWVGAGGD